MSAAFLNCNLNDSLASNGYDVKIQLAISAYPHATVCRR